jgi:hypothetical protein
VSKQFATTNAAACWTSQLDREPPGVYGDEALWRVRYVKTAQNWGLSLREMKSLLGGAVRSPNFCASIRAPLGIAASDPLIGFAAAAEFDEKPWRLG